ncbi:E3 ubiquitin-protein ligase ZNF598 [Wyeomyia smithii]|uniref:E3 ubiquitin-protein ligase ZNF598 n=1 Tax=Wyeomyia smithii TaxID=174621 RepID=UPI002467E96A|nr:E3 ubiquitin-protein ligase ZNF598 [Wyeomyia smithii]
MANYNSNTSYRERRGGHGGGSQKHYQPQQQRQTSKRSTPSESESNEPVCVVCFKPIQYYAIGECDHLCCFECSTRIRVLCRQNDCPICRRDLAKVIFSKILAPYKELDVRNRSGLYDKKYRICFTDGEVQQAFFELLDNRCPRCEEKNFPKFEMLREHVRKAHELFYCDICTEHLKIFSSERRCYSRQDLAIHRRVGDPDNVGHRGHPLCEYCDKRFLDKDELFRHLRKEHFFCHFCDADGTNYFYGDYDTLRDHFRQEHFLCEEGECEQEQFTAVFRTEIDLRAHRASAHGKSMNKLANKQTRTLELEFTYAPRGGGGGPGAGPIGGGSGGGRHHHGRGGGGAGGSGGGGGGGNRGGGSGVYDSQREFDTLLSDPSPTQHPPKRIDASSEQDFPSLGGTSANPVFRPNNVSIRQRVFGVAGLARTKENFPALGSEGGEGSGSTSLNEGFSSKITASSLLKPSQPSGGSSGNGGGAGGGANGRNQPSTSMMIHVSNRPPSGTAGGKSGSNGGKKPSTADFPALPGTTRPGSKISDLYNDMEATSNGMVNLNAMSAKHRALADDYVSVSSMVSKVATVAANKESKKPPIQQNVVPSVNSTKAFPTLSESGIGKSGSGTTTKPAQWVVANKVNASSFATSGGNTGAANVSAKKKPAPAPNLKEEGTFVNLNALTGKKSGNGGGVVENSSGSANSNNNDNKNNNDQSQQQQGGKNKAKDRAKANSNGSNGDTRHHQQKDIENIPSGENFPALGNQQVTDFALANLGGGGGPKRGPPGFENVSANNNNSVRKIPAPPPGFSNVTLNSVARNINNLTFTSSSGESYNILPSAYNYVAPSNASKRNQNLVTHFQRALKKPDALAEFRTISQMFRDGVYNPAPYYEHCKAALGDRFTEIFPELLALLPNITKQQELYLVYCQDQKNIAQKSAGSGGSAKGAKSTVAQPLEVCQVCKQVLVRDDLTEHFQSHYMENNFPKLSANGKSAEVSAAWRK